ncbi:NYN domain-containing protein [Arthrobacter sp. Soil764]|uniref:NYN domain-containing protein n=1 Tax=Arthrobacter sp. Soil764 TaxID=1736403 RepID=UPI001F19E5E3|nr:NYN domain-containing protein [Arthrobacter sp. Soil764]
MNEALPPTRRPGIRAAMFVDFDNVFTGLQAIDPEAAKRFAEDPKHWAEALSAGDSGKSARRFLIRNCYLNPTVYSKYRTYWTRAGFRVIDCPSLTQRGKSSTDINLVLDAMDALSGSVGIEEFFIASADAGLHVADTAVPRRRPDDHRHRGRRRGLRVPGDGGPCGGVP